MHSMKCIVFSFISMKENTINSEELCIWISGKLEAQQLNFWCMWGSDYGHI